MEQDRFAWDESKATANYAKHGITFEAAAAVFRDAFAIEWVDDTQVDPELRFVTIGAVESRLLVVVYTQRGDALRIISARLAEAHERRRYHRENGT